MMESDRDHYHTLGIHPLPDSKHTSLQRIFLLQSVSRDALHMGYDKAKLARQDSAVEEAWAVLGDAKQREKYDKQLLKQATEDGLGG